VQFAVLSPKCMASMTNKDMHRPSAYLLLANIGQRVTLRGDSAPRRGCGLQEIGLIKDAAVLCVFTAINNSCVKCGASHGID
jgi:hypothetical protein